MEVIVWAGNLILGRLQSVFNFEAPYGPVALGGAFVFTIMLTRGASAAAG
jgi:hypothetical protein